MTELRKSLSSVDPNTLTDEEKSFIEGFDNTFTKSDIHSSEDFSYDEEGDFKNKRSDFIYQKVDAKSLTEEQRKNLPLLKPLNCSSEPLVPINAGDKTVNLTSEIFAYEDKDNALVKTDEKIEIEEHVFINGQFSGVDDYIEREPVQESTFKSKRSALSFTGAYTGRQNEIYSNVLFSSGNKRDGVEKYIENNLKDATSSKDLFAKAKLYEAIGDFDKIKETYTSIINSPNTSKKDKNEASIRLNNIETIMTGHNASVNTEVVKTANDQTIIKKTTKTDIIINE